MAKIKYVIALDDKERALLDEIITEGKESERTILRAKILQLSDVVKHPEKRSVEKLAAFLGTTHTTVQTVRAEYGQFGIETALYRKRRTASKVNRRINDDVIKMILEVARSAPPEGHKRWSVRLLSKVCEERGIVSHISPTTVAVLLKQDREMKEGKQ